ncbi:MAG: GtrA family protein [Hyphomicrobiales bacterium]
MSAIERVTSEENVRRSAVARYFRDAGLSADLIKYGLASAMALALDFSVLMICHQLLGFNHLAAAAAGFLSGLALIYALSVRVVFRDRRRVSAGAEVAGFLLSGLAGLVLTEALMHLFVDRMGITPPLSKIPTSALVFLFNFTARRRLLFSRGRTA